MANLYGNANCSGYPFSVTVAAGNVAIPAGPATAIITTAPIIAPSPGYFYVSVLATLNILTGASIPGNIGGAIAIGAGSFTNSVAVTTFGVLPSADFYITLPLWSAVSQTAWQGAGSTITIGVSCATNPVTVMQFSVALVTLMRAPDQ